MIEKILYWIESGVAALIFIFMASLALAVIMVTAVIWIPALLVGWVIEQLGWHYDSKKNKWISRR